MTSPPKAFPFAFKALATCLGRSTHQSLRHAVQCLRREWEAPCAPHEPKGRRRTRWWANNGQEAYKCMQSMTL